MVESKLLAGILVGFCLLALIGSPVTAAPNEGTGKGKEWRISEGLKNDLWDIHTTYRMQFFQLRVDRADAIIKTLNKHDCDVGTIQGIVDKIANYEGNLRTALENRNRQELRQINRDLMELWHQFREEARNTIRICRQNGE